MKKLGFTLSEVLIALSVIGVISALALPTFISGSRNQAFASKLATTVTALENAFTTMIVDEGAQDLSETTFGLVSAPSMEALGKYIKLTDRSTTYELAGYSSKTPFARIDGGTTSASGISAYYKMKSGAIIIYHRDSVERGENSLVPVTSSLGRITIDVNGIDKPNIWGRDAFIFRLGNDGILYPAGSRPYHYLQANNLGVQVPWNSTSSSTEEQCGTKNKYLGCTARLIDNGYKVDY